MTRILAIETSCDETAAAVIEDGRRILSNVVATQIELHSRFGGVFPEVASRQHVLTIGPVIEQALVEAKIDHVRHLDAVAVTQGPGLAGSLLVGVNAAKGLAFASGLPLLAVILMTAHARYQRLGGTLDDAAGEAFDKVARLLGLGFPGGPAIQQAAGIGNPERFRLPRALRHNDEHRFNFSFSGLKTAVLNLVRQLERAGEDMQEPTLVADIAASFQAAVADVLVTKTVDAALSYGARQVCICGGVSANSLLRTMAQTGLDKAGLPLYIPPLFLCTDNAAMIGAAAFYHWRTEPNRPLDLSMDVVANLPLPELGE